MTLDVTSGSVWPVPSRGLAVTYVPLDVGYAIIIKEFAIWFDPIPIAIQVPSPGPWREKYRSLESEATLRAKEMPRSLEV